MLWKALSEDETWTENIFSYIPNGLDELSSNETREKVKNDDKSQRDVQHFGLMPYLISYQPTWRRGILTRQYPRQIDY